MQIMTPQTPDSRKIQEFVVVNERYPSSSLSSVVFSSSWPQNAPTMAKYYVVRPLPVSRVPDVPWVNQKP